MGFLSKFSRSSSKGHYRHGKHGSDYYKRRGHGILGKIIDILNGSRSYSHSHSHHYRRRHSRHSSWS
ncbi:MAG: hypothetical protein A4E55_01018 [Pelotomaculum sp. PtaU1.Bin035]|nr:MAG: hypothetical protein A4E55_01018 [Pelotomaculum sp. PtaU1.Bin035]